MMNAVTASGTTAKMPARKVWRKWCWSGCLFIGNKDFTIANRTPVCTEVERDEPCSSNRSATRWQRFENRRCFATRNNMSKLQMYRSLVDRRKACALCTDLVNPSVCCNGIHDSQH